MSATRLMTNLTGLGIRVEAHRDRLRYSPRSAVTSDLADRMKAHKGELLAMMQPLAETPASPVRGASAAAGPTRELDWIDEAFTKPTKVGSVCGCHREQKWWRSIFGDHLICGICHPPATPDVVKKWHKNE